MQIRVACLWIGLGAAALGIVTTAAAQDGEREQLIRGALVYKFGRFAQWPPRPGSDPEAFVIGVLHDPGFATLIRGKVEGEKVHGLPVKVRNLDDARIARGCHVIFISPMHRAELQGVFDALDGAPVLTVGSQPDFLEAGGMINLVIHDDRVGFAVNVRASQRVGLELDSRLLRVAQRVEGTS